MNILDQALETEEYISAEEYMRRRSEGKIDPAKTRYADKNPKTGALGGFWVKLDKPRYNTNLLTKVIG